MLLYKEVLVMDSEHDHYRGKSQMAWQKTMYEPSATLVWESPEGQALVGRFSQQTSSSPRMSSATEAGRHQTRATTTIRTAPKTPLATQAGQHQNDRKNHYSPHCI